MVFNGHTEQYINSLDEELFAEIQVMYADGMLGNKGIYDAITPLTTAIFNYLRASGAPQFTPDSIFPWINEYSTDPDLDPTPVEKVNDSLLTFISQAQGFDMKNFDNGN